MERGLRESVLSPAQQKKWMLADADDEFVRAEISKQRRKGRKRNGEGKRKKREQKGTENKRVGTELTQAHTKIFAGRPETAGLKGIQR